MSGYDKSPDYGGPEPTWRGTIIEVVVILAVLALIALALRGSTLATSCSENVLLPLALLWRS